MPYIPLFATLCAGLFLTQTPAPVPVPAPPVTPAPVPAPAPPPTLAPPAMQPPETPDYFGAKWEPASPSNFRPSTRPSATEPVNIIVMHDIEGPAMSAVRWFQNPVAQVSSHYVVAADGTVYQQVKERDVAWHAGNREINARAVGIEQEGFAYRPGWFSSQMYESSARLVRDITTRHGIPRDRTHIIGHFEVPSLRNPGKFGGAGGHTDPGPYFDWDYFMRLVRSDARLPEGAKNRAEYTLHPGETGTATFAFTNTGDDPWLSDKKDDPAPERRKQGTVFLAAIDNTQGYHFMDVPGDGITRSGLYGSESGKDESRSALYPGGKGWVSPLYITSAAEGDVPPGATGTYTVPIAAPANASGYGEQAFRLVTIPVAPGTPAAFGDPVSIAVSVKPWEVSIALPETLPAGWNEKTQKDGTRLAWRKPGRDAAVSGSATARDAAPLKWEVNLPVPGLYRVEIRYASGAGKTGAATYRIGSALPETRVVNQRVAGGNGANPWVTLGTFYFVSAPPPTTPTAPTKTFDDGVTLPGVVPAPATIELLGTSSASGIISSGDEIRFVGPLPTGGGG